MLFLINLFMVLKNTISFNEVGKEGIEILLEQLLKVQKLETLMLSLMSAKI